MSSKEVTSPDADAPPYVGALLRMAFESARARVHAAIREAGGTDLHETHLAVFSYPLPDGVRPADLARRLRLSRQATNHVIQQMEALGYIERRAPAGGERRLVYLTPRSRRVAEAIWESMRALEAEWRAEIGAERFATFKEVLRLLAVVPPMAVPASPRSSPRAPPAPPAGR